jgi:hypothetical protein
MFLKGYARNLTFLGPAIILNTSFIFLKDKGSV